MSDLITDDKLGNNLGSDEITKTRIRRFKLKFTDFAIKNFTANFINDQGKTLRLVRVPFDTGAGRSYLKGLKLVQYQRSKKKYFMLRYWHNSKSDDITLGQFEEDKFGTSY